MPTDLSVPATRELAVLELDVGLGRLHQVGRDLLALVDDLLAGVDHRLAADRQRARAVGAHADRGLVGVAVDDVDVLVGHAQLLGDHLREGRLVALAVAVGAGHHLHLAGVGEADLGALPQADAGAERAHHRRGGDAAGLDVAGRGRCRAACRAARTRPCARGSRHSRRASAPRRASPRNCRCRTSAPPASGTGRRPWR